MSKAFLALAVLGVVAVGAVIMLLVGGSEVEEDGVEKDSVGVLR